MSRKTRKVECWCLLVLPSFAPTGDPVVEATSVIGRKKIWDDTDHHKLEILSNIVLIQANLINTEWKKFDEEEVVFKGESLAPLSYGEEMVTSRKQSFHVS